MKSVSAINSLPSISLNQLLRKSSISVAVSGLKILFGLIIFGLLAATVYISVLHVLDANTDIQELRNQVGEMRVELESQPKERKQQKRDYGVIAKTNLFGDVLPVATPSKKTQAPKPNVNKTAFTLIGTVASKTDPLAIIENPKEKVQDVFAIDQRIFGEAILVSVHPNYVEIRRDGQIEKLIIDESESSESTSEPVEGEEDIVVDEGELSESLDNLPLLLTQARAVPYFKDGKSIGLRLFAIKDGSLYKKIGLQNGDILKTINGQNLGNISEAMKLFERLREERSITLILERNRQQKVFRYRVQ